MLPVTTENVTLKGETKDGRIVKGRLEVSDNGSKLAKLWIEPCNAPTLEGVKRP